MVSTKKMCGENRENYEKWQISHSSQTRGILQIKMLCINKVCHPTCILNCQHCTASSQAPAAVAAASHQAAAATSSDPATIRLYSC